MKKILLLFIICFFYLGCDAINKAAKTNEQTLSYNLTVSGCSTGSHAFSTLADYCAGLQNNSLNNFCAVNSRADLFNQNCSGIFTPSIILINSVLQFSVYN